MTKLKPKKKTYLIILTCLILACISLTTDKVKAQDIDNSSADTIKKAPVSVKTKLIRHSNATFYNETPFTGKAYGIGPDIKQYIGDINPKDSSTMPIGEFSDVQFEFEVDGEIKTYTLRVSLNTKFVYNPVPEIALTGIEMVIDNVKKYKGKKLYEINITDDVSPGNITAAATPESSPYIEVIKIDSSIVQVKLKDVNEFARDVPQDVQESIRKGEEVIFPIGIVLKDENVGSDIQEYKIFLKKKKKPKSRR